MKLSTSAVLVVLALLLAACGPSGPATGSPEWLWNAAREAYATGDIEKTTDHLERIEKAGDSPFLQKARAWRLVLEAGHAMASLEMVEAFAEGWKNTRTDKTLFLRKRNEALSEAKRHSIDFFEAYTAFAKGVSDQPVVFEFTFPKGSAAPVGDLDRIYKGMKVPEEAIAVAQTRVSERGVVRAVDAALTGNPDDSAGAQGMLQSGRAEVPAARVLLSSASVFDKLAAVFERKNLQEPDKEKMFRERALDVAKRSLELKPDAAMEKEAKKLTAELEKNLQPDKAKKMVVRR